MVSKKCAESLYQCQHKEDTSRPPCPFLGRVLCWQLPSMYSPSTKSFVEMLTWLSNPWFSETSWYLDNGKDKSAAGFHRQPGWKPEHKHDWRCQLLVWSKQGLILEQLGAIQDGFTAFERSYAMSRKMWTSFWVKQLEGKSMQWSLHAGVMLSTLNPMYAKRPTCCILKT